MAGLASLYGLGAGSVSQAQSECWIFIGCWAGRLSLEVDLKLLPILLLLWLMVLGADWLAGQWLEFGDGLLALGLSAQEGFVAPAVYFVPGVVVLFQGLVVPGGAVGA